MLQLLLKASEKMQLYGISIDRQSFDRNKAAAAARQSDSVLQSIEHTVLTRQSFVSCLQSPDPSRVYKEVWYSPASGLV